ncbi:MAG: class I SAM-dependent methyltransferase [Solirubrobacteraceae bacterium]|nr:class I SAM-dependent methyltransferase [Solirubrobacteraceae bacterium]
MSSRASDAAPRCRICGSAGDLRLTTTDRNRSIGAERFDYRSCRACGTLYLAEVPADLARYYPPDYYPIGAEHETNESERAKVALLQRFVSGGALLEIGPGAGGFAAEALRSGFGVRAIEMDERACDHLRAIGAQAVHSAEPHRALAEMAPARAIVLWHVFEHLAEPLALLRAAAATLEPGGVLLIAVPNPAAFALRVLGARWPHVDAPRHLQLVPAATLVRLAGEVGLAPVALTGSDRAGRDWNVFGWQHFLAPPTSGAVRRRAAFYAAALVSLLLAPVERGGLRGSTYTAVFRNDGGI